MGCKKYIFSQLYFQEWKVWRTYPTMEYRDVHKIIPGSYSWRFPSPASEKQEENFTPDWFTNDYKTSFRNSRHYIRRIRPLFNGPKKQFYNYQIENDAKENLNNLIPDSKSI